MLTIENAILLGSALVLWVALLVFLETMPEQTRRKLLESLRAERLGRDEQNESHASGR